MELSDWNCKSRPPMYVNQQTHLAGQRGDLAAPAEAHDADLALHAFGLEGFDCIVQVGRHLDKEWEHEEKRGKVGRDSYYYPATSQQVHHIT